MSLPGMDDSAKSTAAHAMTGSHGRRARREFCKTGRLYRDLNPNIGVSDVSLDQLGGGVRTAELVKCYM